MTETNVPITDIDVQLFRVKPATAEEMISHTVRTFKVMRLSKLKVILRENDLCEANNSKFLEVNHPQTISMNFQPFSREG